MAQAKGGPAFSLGDLTAGAKGLRQTEGPAPAAKAEGKDASEERETAIQAYVDLYNRFNGNLDQIFDELQENPGKAKKYPPKDAQAFAERYYEGGYTYADEQRAEAK